MTARTHKTARPRSAEKQDRPAPEPVDVHEGIPDRAVRPSRWRLWIVLGIFAAWGAFLLYCLLAGSA